MDIRQLGTNDYDEIIVSHKVTINFYETEHLFLLLLLVQLRYNPIPEDGWFQRVDGFSKGMRPKKIFKRCLTHESKKSLMPTLQVETVQFEFCQQQILGSGDLAKFT